MRIKYRPYSNCPVYSSLYVRRLLKVIKSESLNDAKTGSQIWLKFSLLLDYMSILKLNVKGLCTIHSTEKISQFFSIAVFLRIYNEFLDFQSMTSSLKLKNKLFSL